MNSQIAIIDITSPIGSLEAYIARVNQVPVLSADEEHDLAERLQNNGDLAAARQLVLSHLRFVVKIARGYSGYGLALPDLIQEGTIGLMKAVKRFDPKAGVRLVSFAVHWIKSEIYEFILKNWRIVKIATTKAQRKLFFNLRSMKKRLGWFSKTEVKDVAETLNVSEKAVLEMERRLNARDAAFDPICNDDAGTAPANYLPDISSNPATLAEGENSDNDQKERLALALNKLDNRSRSIISRRWLGEPKATLQELAREYGISAERVRQLESMAMGKIRKFIKVVSSHH